MGKPPRPWTVIPHGPLIRVEDNLRVVTSGLPRGNMPRTMMVAKFSDGRLLFFNAVPLEEILMTELEAWGRPAFLVVPNPFHRLDIHAFRERYPEMRLVAPKAIAAQVSQVAPVELSTEEVPKDPNVELIPLRGGKTEEPVLVVRTGERVSLCFGDAVMNLGHVKGLDGFLFKLIGSTGGPKVTPLAKRMLVDNAGLFRAHLQELAILPGLKRLIPSHGDIIDNDAAAVLSQVAQRM